MSDNNYSPLITLRFNDAGDKQLKLEMWDPEVKNVRSIPPEQLSSIENIHDVITSIKSNVQNEQESLPHYTQWLNKGWHKSIDYYVASRADVFDQNNHTCVSQEDYSSVNATDLKKRYSVPQAMVHRKTKRGFRRETLQNQIFHAGLENGCSKVHEGYKIYLVVYDVEGVTPAIYSYDVKNKSLSLVREGLFAEEMSLNIQGMRTPKTACFSIVFVADFEKLLKLMPHPRGLRNVYIEAGRLAQNLIISYMQHGVFCLVTPALRDREVLTLLKLKEPDFSPLYSLTFGFPIN